MDKITKFLLSALVPIALVILAIVIIPKENDLYKGLTSLILLIIFIGAFVNIFIQTYRFNKTVAKDPQLQQIVNQRLALWNFESTWPFLIIFLVLIGGLSTIFKYYNLNNYLRFGIAVVIGVVFYLIWKNFKKKDNSSFHPSKSLKTLIL